MNVDDVSWLEWGFKGAVSVLFTIGAWMWIMMVKAVSRNRDDIIKVHDELAEHRVKTVETYATKVDFTATMAAISDTVKRTHERIDRILDILMQQGGR